MLALHRAEYPFSGSSVAVGRAHDIVGKSVNPIFVICRLFRRFYLYLLSRFCKKIIYNY